MQIKINVKATPYFDDFRQQIDYVAYESENAVVCEVLEIKNQKIGFAHSQKSNMQFFEIMDFELLAINIGNSIILISTITGDLKFKVGIDFDFISFKIVGYFLLVVSDLILTIINLNTLSIPKTISVPDNIIDVIAINSTLKIKTINGEYEKSI